jgi:hypothetical protein
MVVLFVIAALMSQDAAAIMLKAQDHFESINSEYFSRLSGALPYQLPLIKGKTRIIHLNGPNSPIVLDGTNITRSPPLYEAIAVRFENLCKTEATELISPVWSISQQK